MQSTKQPLLRQVPTTGGFVHELASADSWDNILLENLPIGVFVIDVQANGRFLCSRANRKFGEVLGKDDVFTFNELLKKTGRENDAVLIANLRTCIETGEMVVFEWQRADGHSTRHLECHFSPVSDKGGKIVRIVGTASDRTMQRRAERQLLHDALHDDLTNLPNRVMFTDELEQVANYSAGRKDHQFGLLVMNIDRLNIVNETLGHLAGDELLIAVATRLKKCVRPEDTLARLGGDEFGLLLDDIEGTDEACAIAEMIHKRMQIPFNLGGAEVFISFSIGIAGRHCGETDIEMLLSDAALAMQKAKTEGKARTETYSKSLKQRPRSRLQLETDFRRAVARREFQLHYQPLVSLGTGRLAGFEALSRWRHPDRGMISPVDFIRIAEETGLIIELGRWSTVEACQQHRAWLDKFPEQGDVTVSVNVSSLQFKQDDLCAMVTEVLAETGLPGRNLKLEITESAIMENADRAAEILRDIKSLGVGFALDDFGTGYSSLSYLNRFPIDILKIDRSFVSQMHETQESYQIVSIIAALAQTLGLEVVAEGIETARQLNDLRDLGCHIGQGYLFSAALPPAKAEQFLRHKGQLIPTPEKR